MNPKNNTETISYGENEVIIKGKISTNDREKILNYLKEKTLEGKRKRVIISHNEINDLKKAMESNPNKINEFMESQEKETISSSEIMEGSEIEKNVGGREKLKIYLDISDEATYKYFFDGEKALFKGLNISEDAKRNFSVGANFFIINNLNKKFKEAKLDGDIGNLAKEFLGNEGKEGALKDLPELLKKGDGFLGAIEEKWSFLSEISFLDIGKTLNSFFGSEKLKILSEASKELKLESNGENNGVFMNPLKSHELMEYVFNKQNLTKEDIINHVNEQKGKNINFTEKDKKDLQLVGDKLKSFVSPEMGGVLGKGLDIKKFFEDSKEDMKKSILGNKQVLEILGTLGSLPWIGGIIKNFLSFLGVDLNKENFKASKSIIKTSIIGKGSFFEGKEIPTNFMITGSGDDDETFVENISFLTGNNKLEEAGERIEKLFNKDSNLFVFYNKVKESQNLGELYSLNKINYSGLSKTINLYKEYNLALKDKSISSIEDFIEKKSNEKEESSSKRNKNDILLSQGTKVDLIDDDKNFEIKDDFVEYVFEHNNIKYKTLLLNDGTLTINGGGKIINFSGGEEIYKGLAKFKGKLENKANARDFGEDTNIELNQKTIKEILLNGMHEELKLNGPLSFMASASGKDTFINKDGLKDQIIKAFISKEGLKNQENISIDFFDYDITLTRQGSNGFSIESNNTSSDDKIANNEQLRTLKVKKKTNEYTFEDGVFEIGNLRVFSNGKKIRFKGIEYEIDKNWIPESLIPNSWYSYETNISDKILEVDGKKINLTKLYKTQLKDLKTAPNKIKLEKSGFSYKKA